MTSATTAENQGITPKSVEHRDNSKDGKHDALIAVRSVTSARTAQNREEHEVQYSRIYITKHCVNMELHGKKTGT